MHSRLQIIFTKQLLAVIPVLLVSAGVMGCHVKGVQDDSAVWPPKWFETSPRIEGMLVVTAVGTSPKASRAYEDAVAKARVDLGAVLQTKVDALTTSCLLESKYSGRREYFGDLFKRIGRQVVEGTIKHGSVVKSQTRFVKDQNRFECAVLMVMPGDRAEIEFQLLIDRETAETTGR